jgi:hypothetical protein
MSLNRILNYNTLYSGGEDIYINDLMINNDLNINMTPLVTQNQVLEINNAGDIVWVDKNVLPGGAVSLIKIKMKQTDIDSETFKEIEIESVGDVSAGIEIEDDKYIKFLTKGIYLVFVNAKIKINVNSVCYELKSQIKVSDNNVNPAVGFDTNLGVFTTQVYSGIPAGYFANASGKNLHNFTTNFTINTNNPNPLNTYLKFSCKKLSDTFQNGQIMPDDSIVSIIRVT